LSLLTADKIIQFKIALEELLRVRAFGIEIKWGISREMRARENELVKKK
jgi:hypothetical protein